MHFTFNLLCSFIFLFLLFFFELLISHCVCFTKRISYKLWMGLPNIGKCRKCAIRTSNGRWNNIWHTYTEHLHIKYVFIFHHFTEYSWCFCLNFSVIFIYFWIWYAWTISCHHHKNLAYDFEHQNIQCKLRTKKNSFHSSDLMFIFRSSSFVAEDRFIGRRSFLQSLRSLIT